MCKRKGQRQITKCTVPFQKSDQDCTTICSLNGWMSFRRMTMNLLLPDLIFDLEECDIVVYELCGQTESYTPPLLFGFQYTKEQ